MGDQQPPPPAPSPGSRKGNRTRTHDMDLRSTVRNPVPGGGSPPPAGQPGAEGTPGHAGSGAGTPPVGVDPLSSTNLEQGGSSARDALRPAVGSGEGGAGLVDPTPLEAYPRVPPPASVALQAALARNPTLGQVTPPVDGVTNPPSVAKTEGEKTLKNNSDTDSESGKIRSLNFPAAVTGLRYESLETADLEAPEGQEEFGTPYRDALKTEQYVPAAVDQGQAPVPAAADPAVPETDAVTKALMAGLTKALESMDFEAMKVLMDAMDRLNAAPVDAAPVAPAVVNVADAAMPGSLGPDTRNQSVGVDTDAVVVAPVDSADHAGNQSFVIPDVKGPVAPEAKLDADGFQEVSKRKSISPRLSRSPSPERILPRTLSSIGVRSFDALQIEEVRFDERKSDAAPVDPVPVGDLAEPVAPVPANERDEKAVPVKQSVRLRASVEDAAEQLRQVIIGGSNDKGLFVRQKNLLDKFVSDLYALESLESSKDTNKPFTAKRPVLPRKRPDSIARPAGCFWHSSEPRCESGCCAARRHC